MVTRAGLKPMQPMQLHWAPRHGVWVDCSFLPTARSHYSEDVEKR